MSIRQSREHNVSIKGPDGLIIEVELEIKYHHIAILPYIGIKRKKYPALYFTIIYAIEKDNLQGREI